MVARHWGHRHNLSRKNVNLTDEIRELVDDTLALGGRSKSLKPSSPLLGSVPELDSVGVVSILTALEERYGLAVNDDEISADTFATLESLVRYVQEKIDAGGS
jgi:acyl carrier protein